LGPGRFRCIIGREMELLERVAEAKGRLLRVQCYRERAGKAPRLVSGLLLTFDVGRILVWADPAQNGEGGLSYMHVEDTEDLSAGLVELDEREPWWRVLGSPLFRVRRKTGPGGVCLQFRASDSNPRFIDIVQKDRLIEFSAARKSAGS